MVCRHRFDSYAPPFDAMKWSQPNLGKIIPIPFWIHLRLRQYFCCMKGVGHSAPFLAMQFFSTTISRKLVLLVHTSAHIVLWRSTRPWSRVCRCDCMALPAMELSPFLGLINCHLHFFLVIKKSVDIWPICPRGSKSRWHDAVMTWWKLGASD